MEIISSFIVELLLVKFRHEDILYYISLLNIYIYMLIVLFIMVKALIICLLNMILLFAAFEKVRCMCRSKVQEYILKNPSVNY